MNAKQVQDEAHTQFAVELHSPRASLPRVLGVWTLLAFLMSANGVFRETVLASLIRRTGADILSAAMGIGIILTTTRYFLRRAKGNEGLEPGSVATIWLALTLVFEICMGHFVDHKSWSQLVGNYAIWRGKLWPVVLLSIVLAPFLWLGHSRPKAATNGVGILRQR